MYLGSYAIHLDAKGRFAVPAKVREQLVSSCAGRIVITAHTEERCLLMYPEQQWQELLPKIEALPNVNQKVSRMQRLLLGYATALVLDDVNGRLLLAPTLRHYAGLEKRLMLVGQGKKLELWAEERWLAYVDSTLAVGDVPQEVLDLSL